MNLIKDDLRNKLGEIILDNAMRIAIEGLNMKEFDFLSAYSKWLQTKDRKHDEE